MLRCRQSSDPRLGWEMWPSGRFKKSFQHIYRCSAAVQQGRHLCKSSICFQWDILATFVRHLPVLGTTEHMNFIEIHEMTWVDAGEPIRHLLIVRHHNFWRLELVSHPQHSTANGCTVGLRMVTQSRRVQTMLQAFGFLFNKKTTWEPEDKTQGTLDSFWMDIRLTGLNLFCEDGLGHGLSWTDHELLQ